MRPAHAYAWTGDSRSGLRCSDRRAGGARRLTGGMSSSTRVAEEEARAIEDLIPPTDVDLSWPPRFLGNVALRLPAPVVCDLDLVRWWHSRCGLADLPRLQCGVGRDVAAGRHGSLQSRCTSHRWMSSSPSGSADRAGTVPPVRREAERMISPGWALAALLIVGAIEGVSLAGQGRGARHARRARGRIRGTLPERS